MKKIILTLVMSVSILLSIAADLYVNGSGNANTYTTIQAAVNAASSGDNIYVATVGTYSENVSISNKSLFIIAAVAGEEFTLSGNFTLNPGVGNEVTIIGLYNGNVQSAGTNSSGTVNLISSFISSIDFQYTGNIKVNVYDCEVTNSFMISNGSVKGCRILGGLNIYNSSYASGDTIRIMANNITNGLSWMSSNAYFEICNNYINKSGTTSYTVNAVAISNMQTTAGGTNLLANNTIIAISSSGAYNNNPNAISLAIGSAQNLVIANNYLYCLNTYYTSLAGYPIYGSTTISNALIANNYWYSPNGSFSSNLSNSSLVDNGTASVNWSYSASTGIISSSSAVNQGLDQIEYRDINNTRNDIGTSGGPHAWSNYNTTTGKAAIFNLELPFQLYIGGNHNIKAKGFHKN